MKLIHKALHYKNNKYLITLLFSIISSWRLKPPKLTLLTFSCRNEVQPCFRFDINKWEHLLILYSRKYYNSLPSFFNCFISVTIFLTVFYSFPVFTFPLSLLAILSSCHPYLSVVCSIISDGFLWKTIFVCCYFCPPLSPPILLFPSLPLVYFLLYNLISADCTIHICQQWPKKERRNLSGGDWICSVSDGTLYFHQMGLEIISFFFMDLCLSVLKDNLFRSLTSRHNDIEVYILY